MRRPIHLLPKEIWNHIVSLLVPLDHRSLSQMTKHAPSLLSSKQHENAALWAQIIRRIRWISKAFDEGIDLVLVGCLNEIGNTLNEKPYLYLGTFPPRDTVRFGEEGLWSALRGKGKEILYDVERGVEKDFTNFTLNYEAIFNLGRIIKFPPEQVQKWKDGKVFALHYNTSSLVPATITTEPAAYGYGLDIWMKFEGESYLFRSPKLV